MALQKLSSFQELEQLLKQNKHVLLLKNSTTCPVSHQAYQEYETYASEIEDSVYYLNVQEAREFSNEIAEKFSVKHESPQVLLWKDSKVIWHTSHWNITYKALTERVKS